MLKQIEQSASHPMAPDPLPVADRDLIQACREGNGSAWERLLDKYERLVFSIPLNYGLSSDEAADITQITFTILTQSLDNLRDDTPLAPWLVTVARRHTWRWLARSRREVVDPDEDIMDKEAFGDEHSALEDWERLDWLNQGLNLLGERCRKLLLALYFEPEQPSYAKIASRLNMPVGSIGPTRARCLEQLKRILS